MPFDEIIQSTNLLLADAASTANSITSASADAASLNNEASFSLVGVVKQLLHNPTLWSVMAMTTIVGLLVAWEEAIEKIRHNTPKPIMPVIDSMLAEVGGLGFIGLFLSTIVTGGPLGRVVSSLSEEFLGDDELLIETFEFLHTFFFQVGILFFVIAGVVVGAVLQEVQNLSEISALAMDADGDGEVSLDELADALKVQSMIVDMDGDGIITDEEKVEALRMATPPHQNVFADIYNEYTMSNTERAGEQLVVRERMMEQMKLPDTFRIEDYFAQIFGRNLKEVVELSPVTWLPLIPLIAIDNSVDLTRDVVSASSSNAFDSCGYFFATPWVLYPTIFIQVASLIWALFIFWKVSTVKNMLLPTIVKENSDSEAILLPPRYEDEYFMNRFESSPSIFGWGEQFFTGGGSKTYPARNAHEELFGASGAKFPKIYRQAIQIQTWLTVALIVYSTTQIIYRDTAALYLGADVGCSETVVQELILWSVFVASSMFQLSMAPTTFLNYCFVTSVEGFVRKDIVKKSIVQEEDDRDGWNGEVQELISPYIPLNLRT